MNGAYRDRAADFSGIVSAGHGGWWEGGGVVVIVWRKKMESITRSSDICRTYTIIAQKDANERRSVNELYFL